MTGGAARDTFIWTKANQSGVKGAAIDQITDFTHRTDKLDFSDLTQAAIKLHIKGAFTGTGPSIITKEIAGTTRVLVDSDGDGSANMRIDLLDTLGVTATDFIL